MIKGGGNIFVINGERFEELKEYNGYAIGDNGTFLTKKNKEHQWRPLAQSHTTTSMYLQVRISHKGQHKHLNIHRLVAEYFVDGKFEGAVVGHKDANIYNNHYTNLKWITQKDNIHQSYTDSGIGAMRNYCKYIICYNNIPISDVLYGSTAVRKYIENNNLDTSYSSLMRYKLSRNYSLIEYNKNQMIDC